MINRRFRGLAAIMKMFVYTPRNGGQTRVASRRDGAYFALSRTQERLISLINCSETLFFAWIVKTVA